MLEAQKVIEDVESEAGEYVPKAELARLRSKFFDIQDSTSVDGRFIAAISGVAHNAQLWRYVLCFGAISEIHPY